MRYRIGVPRARARGWGQVKRRSRPALCGGRVRSETPASDAICHEPIRGKSLRPHYLTSFGRNAPHRASTAGFNSTHSPNTSQNKISTSVLFDILLRVNADESRVKRIEDSRTSQISDLLSGGSFRFGVQSPDYQAFRARVVPRHRTGGLLAMPRGRYPYPRPSMASLCCFGHGDAGRRQQSRGYRLIRFEQSAPWHTLRGCVVHRLPFRILLSERRSLS